jgi:hypothetical protein
MSSLAWSGQTKAPDPLLRVGRSKLGRLLVGFAVAAIGVLPLNLRLNI